MATVLSAIKRDLALFVGVFILDQLMKCYLLHLYPIGTSLSIGAFGSIELLCTITTNQGAAWGFFDQVPMILLGLRLCFVFVLLYLYWISKNSALIRIAFVLILAGALSNIFDVLYRGHVIDMIHFRFWGWSYPVFNLADAAICLGALFVGVDSTFNNS